MPSVAVLPFPSDFYLVDDPSTITGRRLSFPQEALPEHVPAKIFDDADGISMTPTILAWLPGGVDLASLPDPLDPIDSINFVHRLTKNRFPGLGPMKASVYMAVNDSQVRNILTEWTCRTAGVPLITPSAKDIWGLETITAAAPEGAVGVNSALHVWDEHATPSPITNVPPLEDNGTHSSSNRIPSMQEAWYQFLEFGRFVQVCDGPCDPE